MSTASPWQAWFVAAAVFFLFFVFAPVRTRDGRSFQIDEAHKISETHFLRLFVRGDFHSREWFRNIVDRTNPPVGKYILGSAIVLHGLPLPPAPSLAIYAADGRIPAAFPRAVNARYARYLAPARRATLLATALTAALLVWSAMRLHSMLAAAGALFFFTLHHLTLGFGAIAVFDPLVALMGMAIVPPVWILWRGQGGIRRWIAAIAAGVICGLAIGIRFNGGVCLLFAAAVTLIAGARHRSRSTLVAGVIVVLTTAVVVVALNPYFWAAAPVGQGVAEEFSRNEALPLRVVNRFSYQLRDLSLLIAGLDGALMHSLTRRSGFFGLTMFGDVPGFLLWIGVSLGILLPLLRRRVSDDLRFVWLWAAVVGGVTALWLPVAWQRYLMVALPPLALMGGIGLAEMVAAIRNYRRPAAALRSAA